MFSFFNQNKDTEQEQLLRQVEELKSRQNDPIARIALSNLERSKRVIDKAINHEEILITDMYEANRIPLSMLEKGDVFYGVSAITNPIDWTHDKSLVNYKNTNFEQAQKGVQIERTFVLQSADDVEGMRTIMNEQVAQGIYVRYVLEDELRSLSYFPDFTIVPKFNLSIYVPNLHNLTTCVATDNVELGKELMKDYQTVERYAKVWTPTT